MAEPMILAYLTSLYGSASDTFIRQEVRQLRALGHTVHTFSIRQPALDHAVSDDVREAQSTTDYILASGKLVKGAFQCLFTWPGRLLRAAALAWRTRAPGVKAALLQGAYLAEAAYLATRLKAMNVQHVHNHIGMNSATVAMLAAEIARISWSMTVHGPHDFIEPMRWALPQKMHRAAFTVFIAEFGRSQGMMLSDPDVWPRLHVVRCGLDGAFLHQAAPPVATEPRLVFVGRLSPEKGAALLLDAVASLKAEGVPVQLTMIGDGPSRAALEAASDRLGLDGDVRWLGWRGSEAVREAIAQSRALVLPSFAEGLPIVLMETMALRRPVIATQIAGIPELVRHERNGLLIPAGSVDALREAVRTIVTAPVDRLAEMGACGAADVAAKHDAAANARQLEALLAQAVHGKGRA